MSTITTFHGSPTILEIIKDRKVYCPSIAYLNHDPDHMAIIRKFMDVKFHEYTCLTTRLADSVRAALCAGDTVSHEIGFKQAKTDEALADIASTSTKYASLASIGEYKEMKRRNFVHCGPYDMAESFSRLRRCRVTKRSCGVLEFTIPQEMKRAGLDGDSVLIKHELSLEYLTKIHATTCYSQRMIRTALKKCDVLNPVHVVLMK